MANHLSILMLNYEFPPLGGGAAKATLNIAKELARLGHSVDVLTSRADGHPQAEKILGYTVYRVHSFRKGIHDCGFVGAFTYVLFAYPKLLKLCGLKHYDVVHYFFGLPTGILSLLPGRHRKSPYIVSLRGSDVPGYDQYQPVLQAIHACLKPVTRTIWRKAASVVALSTALRADAHRTDATLDIGVIPNGVDCDLFTSSEKRVANDGPLRLICVTRLIERKGLQHVFQALAEIPSGSATLTIVGEGNYENSLRALAQKLGLNDRITFHGYCPREELSLLYNQHDVFIMPSLSESFGNVFTEAMACGLPIIGGRVGGVVDIVKEENGILVTPGNVPEIKNAIMRMKNNASMRIAMGKPNRTRAATQYSWGQCTKQYLTVYQSVLRQ